MSFSRRHFIKLVGGIAATAAGLRYASAAPKAHVVIIGGGFAGATCARYLRKADASIAITLIEQDKTYVTYPFSNLVMGGIRWMKQITQTYEGLRRDGIDIVHAKVRGIDAAARRVDLTGGTSVTYDRLVMAPGISFKWQAIEGYGAKSVELMPHAWRGAQQITALHRKIITIKNGGLLIISVPANPYRAPTAPYERASMIAHWYKQRKPNTKILILDAKDQFPMQDFFLEGWSRFYPGMIEWVPASKGGAVRAANPKKMFVETDRQKHQAQVFNIIPPQTAGQVALQAGLANETGFCPVNPQTLESTKQTGVYVIGDAAIADPMSKSAFAANSHGKLAAAAIAASLRGGKTPEPILVDSTYSFIAPQYAASMAGVYRINDKRIVEVPGTGGTSIKGADDDSRRYEAAYADGWYANLTADTWGS